MARAHEDQQVLPLDLYVHVRAQTENRARCCSSSIPGRTMPMNAAALNCLRISPKVCPTHAPNVLNGPLRTFLALRWRMATPSKSLNVQQDRAHNPTLRGHELVGAELGQVHPVKAQPVEVREVRRVHVALGCDICCRIPSGAASREPPRVANGFARTYRSGASRDVRRRRSGSVPSNSSAGDLVRSRTSSPKSRRRRGARKDGEHVHRAAGEPSRPMMSLRRFVRRGFIAAAPRGRPTERLEHLRLGAGRSDPIRAAQRRRSCPAGPRREEPEREEQWPGCNHSTPSVRRSVPIWYFVEGAI